MAASVQDKPSDVARLVLEETERRLDAYQDLARPGEDDSPIKPMDATAMWVVAILAIALIALWLIGRFVVLPIYV